MAYCTHLVGLEEELRARGIALRQRRAPELPGGAPSYLEWSFYECTFDVESVVARLQLTDPVKVWDEFDWHFGGELGFTCEACRYGVMGIHPEAREHALRTGSPAPPLYG